jgi:TRAP-type C4-dicarboxylate transport system permease large subunit
MVVLGSLVNLSIVTLFLAGFLPAFLLAAALGGRCVARPIQAWPTAARVALLVGLALIAAFPSLTLVLPRLFLGYGG